MRVTTPVLAAIGALALAGGALVVAPVALATSQPPAAVSTVRSCARPTAPHVMACHSLRRTDIAAPLAIAPKASPAGYGPSSLLPGVTRAPGEDVITAVSLGGQNRSGITVIRSSSRAVQRRSGDMPGWDAWPGAAAFTPHL